MKCPNCEREVSPEFNVCPWCDFKPKKCSKPEHQDFWLPAEARFCPRCGEPLEGGTEESGESGVGSNNGELIILSITVSIIVVLTFLLLVLFAVKPWDDEGSKPKPAAVEVEAPPIEEAVEAVEAAADTFEAAGDAIDAAKEAIQ